MKALLLLPILLLLGGSLVSAQATPTPSTNWTTVQRCITAPSQPPHGWTFSGVIFTFKQDDGVHALRADVATPYYVAYDSDSEFGVAGGFSPDGRWFAVPEGRSAYDNAISRDYTTDEIRVYDTSPAHKMLRVSFQSVTEGINSAYSVEPVRWLEDQHFIAYGSLGTPALDGGKGYILSPFDQSNMPIGLPDGAHFVSASPDNSRWIYDQQGLSPQNVDVRLTASSRFESAVVVPIAPSFNTPITPFPQWTSDSSEFAAVLRDGSSIGVFDRDGKQLYSIAADAYTRLSFAHDGERLAYMTRGGTIHIADLKTRTITDTCIAPDYGLEGGLAFSPDGSNLAFSLPQSAYVYILDLEAWQTYRIDLAAADVVGWYPIT